MPQLYFSSLKCYNDTEICSPDYLAMRYISRTGRIVAEYLRDIAILTRDLFRNSSQSRLNFQYDIEDAIENDACWNHDNLIQSSRYVLKYCGNCNRTRCPFKIIMAQYQLR